MSQVKVSPEGPFDCPEWSVEVLKLVKEWATYRSEHPFEKKDVLKPLDNRGNLNITFRDDGPDVWYRDWIKKQKVKMWFALMRAADRLGAEDLIDLCAIMIATHYSKYTEEQRDVLFGPMPHEDEETDIRKDYKVSSLGITIFSVHRHGF
jgi:hypothetical protein